MRLQSYLRPEAEKDLGNAAVWYEQQRTGLGNEFLAEFLLVAGRIEVEPQMYPIVHKKIRRGLLRRFPFSVYYIIETEAVSILGVMHSSRHPQRWQSRT